MAKFAMLQALSFLLLCYGVGNVHCSTVHENSEDYYLLLDFKNGISDPYGALSSWTRNTNFCRWNGVNCTLTRPYRVTELVLPGQNLAGQISSSLGNLTYLNKLVLTNNSFHGPIPLLNKLLNLKYLSLGINLLQGAILDALTNCSNLVSLDLSKNNLTGVIPPRIGFLTKLESLLLYGNSLSGVIPPGLGNITDLSAIALSQNQLNGPIPTEFWRMPNIAWLYLAENNLSGGIPQTLSNLSSLQQLSLSFNSLSNALPSNFGAALPNLEILYLANNMFQGYIPASLANASGLLYLDLSSNKFTGQVPSIFGKFSMLSTLNLEGNMLNASDSAGWEFFDALANCTSLNVLSLAGNNLQGAIPNSLANLSTSLTRLIMSDNYLSGTVPSSIGKLNTSLIHLALDGNNLTGTIEEWIGKLTNLQGLNLGGNNFEGTIPTFISDLTHLSILVFANNKFTGSIPPSLGNLQHLTNLNHSGNNFQGSIPLEFGNLKQLVLLDVSSNKLSGKIPETLGQCQQLVTIQMDQNVLTGNIPTTFSNLYSLSILSLSHNFLSGPMPSCLNNLKLLTKLDLSYNNFEGEIPSSSVFDNTAVVSLDGNPGLCGGATDLHAPACHFVSRREETVNYLVKILIPVFSFMSLIMLIYIVIRGKIKTPERPYLLLFSFGKKFPVVSFEDLSKATGNFSEPNLIGRGSYGSVYKGMLTRAKIEVAIKVFDLQMRSADKSFVSECEVFRNIRHRNLLPILTACSTIDNRGNDFKALIYEFMHNGNLDTWLHHRRDCVAPKGLSLVQRISIATDIADALAYLHHDCGRPVAHCDLKPTNIFLDDVMNAYLGDFGIASLILDSRPTTHERSCSDSSVAVTGTIGYIPPEYAQSVRASTHGDVYSFGIVLLEMLTGKRPTDSMFEGGLTIVSLVERNFPDQVFCTIDGHLQEECKVLFGSKAQIENEACRCLLSLVQVALSCTRPFPRERMNMREVAVNLHSVRRAYVAAIK